MAHALGQFGAQDGVRKVGLLGDTGDDLKVAASLGDGHSARDREGEREMRGGVRRVTYRPTGTPLDALNPDPDAVERVSLL